MNRIVFPVLTVGSCILLIACAVQLVRSVDEDDGTSIQIGRTRVFLGTFRFRLWLRTVSYPAGEFVAGRPVPSFPPDEVLESAGVRPPLSGFAGVRWGRGNFGALANRVARPGRRLLPPLVSPRATWSITTISLWNLLILFALMPAWRLVARQRARRRRRPGGFPIATGPVPAETAPRPPDAV